jgi:hypothetical protein
VVYIRGGFRKESLEARQSIQTQVFTSVTQECQSVTVLEVFFLLALGCLAGCRA